MTTRAHALEERARDAIAEDRLDDALAWLSEALALREAAQGEAHPDLIWTLSLMIEAHRWSHTRDSAALAARVGERLLALRRPILADAPDELARSIRWVARLHWFEDERLDPARIDALEAEARVLDPLGGP